MRMTQFSASNPAAIAAAALIVLLFGALSLLRLPIQLLPDTKDPQIWINVQWREAAPNEVEEALIDPIEIAMKGVSGMKEMRSQINRGGGGVSLTFRIGTDMTRVMLDVVSRLNTLPPLPPDADKPQVFDGAPWTKENAASIMVRPLPGNDVKDIAATYQKLIEEVVEPRLSRVDGVSEVGLDGGRPSEVQIRFDPHRLAALNITPKQIAQAVIDAHDSTAGFTNVGRRQFTVRFTGREPVAELGNLIIGWSNDRPLYLRDVTDIAVGLQDQQQFSYRNGVPGYFIAVRRTSTANIVAVLDGIKVALAELNAGPLAKEKLIADLSWDSSVYVHRAIGFVQESLVVGILLAVGGLWYFLRGPRALLVIGATIPLSLAFAVVTLHLLGRSLNVISLAGLAFSTGIVTDAALIVQGNIIRFMQQGHKPLDATIQGAQEVIPALLASMLTSVAIFLPVLFMEGLEGQLFKDLAITMSVSHAASLLVAMTVIPAANRWALARQIPADEHDHWWKAMAGLAMRATSSTTARALIIGLLIPGSLLFCWLAAPKPDYLPVAQTDNVWGNFSLPPGGNIETVRDEMGPKIIERLKPYLEGRAEPHIKYYNFSAWGGGGGGLVVAYAADPHKTQDVVDLLRTNILADLPDVRVFASQGSLFNLDGGNSRNIELDFQGPDLDALMNVARIAEKEIPQAIPGTFPRSQPSLDLDQPEIQLQPDEWRISHSGATRGDIADALRAFTGGLWAGRYFDGNRRMDIIVKSTQWHSPEELAELPIATPGAGIQTVSELAHISQTVGPSQLSRVNGRRTVSVNFEPPDNMSLDEAVTILQNKVEPKLRAAMGDTVQLGYGGSANELAEALKAMASNFALALVMLMMLMSALFRSVWDSLLVMLVIPVSVAGGIAALRVIGWFDFQALDLLTMIGFIILLGLVVNAAILLVDQTRAREHAGLSRSVAVREALETRARPILLSTLTAVLGMLPLILMPGLGAKIYRGLAAVVSGGMIVGTLFTWFLMPALLRLGEVRRARATAAVPAASPEIFGK